MNSILLVIQNLAIVASNGISKINSIKSLKNNNNVYNNKRIIMVIKLIKNNMILIEKDIILESRPNHQNIKILDNNKYK